MILKGKDLKAYSLEIVDPQAGSTSRSRKMAEIKDNALDFANQVLLDLNFPSALELQIGIMRGFDSLAADVEKTSGVVNVSAAFSTLSNRRLHFDVPIPVVRGKFQRPSLIMISGKKHVLSQELIDRWVGRLEVIRPVVIGYPNPSRFFIHEETIGQPIFSTPPTPVDRDLEWDSLGLY